MAVLYLLSNVVPVSQPRVPLLPGPAVYGESLGSPRLEAGEQVVGDVLVVVHALPHLDSQWAGPGE